MWTISTVGYPIDKTFPEIAHTYGSAWDENNKKTLKLVNNGTDFSASTNKHGIDVSCHISTCEAIGVG